MHQPISLDECLYRAGQHVVRSRLFFDLWFYFEGAETRPNIVETMREYNEFFRFTPHAYFVAYVVHIAGMFDKRKDTISLTRLAREMKAAHQIQGQAITEVDALLAQATPVASKVIILRHNAFAHRSASISYDAAFKKAAVTAAQLRDLTELALKIVNRLLLARGLKGEVFTPLPLEAAEAMMKALAAKTP
jgi:HEPN superfamily AbiU2-like protein